MPPESTAAANAAITPHLVRRSYLCLVDTSGLVVQADLPTVLAVAGVALAGLIGGPLIRRAWSERRSRLLANRVAEAVVAALDARRPPDSDAPG